MSAQVKKLALEFASFWSTLLRDYPRYTLDFSWPSLGTLDLIMEHLFDQTDFSEVEEALIRRCSAYLSIMATSFWENVSEDIHTDISLIEDREFDIRISLSGKQFGGRSEKLELAVYRLLREALQSRESALRVFSGYEAPEHWLRSRITLFGLALFSGLHAKGEGKWASSKYEDVKSLLAPLAKRLGETSARYYEVVFPTEPFGATSEPYLGRILPPIGFKEDFFCGRASFILATTLKQASLDDEQRREIALNLALSPDLQLAAPGLAVAIAISLSDPSERLIAVSEGFGSSRLLLKQAVTLSRQALDLPAVFKHAADSELSPEIELLLQGEMSLGLLPHWRIGIGDLLCVPALTQLLYWGMTHQARQAIDVYFETNERRTALILQGIYLDLVNGNLERARAELQDEKHNSAMKTLPDGALKSLRNELIGSIASLRGDAELAVSMLRRASDAPGISVFRKSALLNLLAQAQIGLGEEEAALESFSSAIRLHPNTAAQIGKIRLLQKLKPEDSFVEDLAAILRHAPRNEIAFQLLVAEKLRLVV